MIIGIFFNRVLGLKLTVESCNSLLVRKREEGVAHRVKDMFRFILWVIIEISRGFCNPGMVIPKAACGLVSVRSGSVLEMRITRVCVVW